MKNTLLHQAAKFKLQNRKHKRWQKAVSILACICELPVIFPPKEKRTKIKS